MEASAQERRLGRAVVCETVASAGVAGPRCGDSGLQLTEGRD